MEEQSGNLAKKIEGRLNSSLVRLLLCRRHREELVQVAVN